MMCPICRNNGVSFPTVWIRSGYGRFTCRDCGSALRIKKNIWLALLSALLGCAAFTLGITTKNWFVFSFAVLFVFVLDGVIDWHFRVLISVEKE